MIGRKNTQQGKGKPGQGSREQQPLAKDASITECEHPARACLNPFEFIRKYSCGACGAVMMCACDEDFGRRFLAHQLSEGTVLETQERVSVTHGFQKDICNSCRGIAEEPAPRSAIPGRTSKIQRYYWREIYFEKTIRFDAWAREQGYEDAGQAQSACPAKYEEIERQAIAEIKTRHERAPKYQYQEESQHDLIERYEVPVLALPATYVKTKDKRVSIFFEGSIWGVEDFVIRHFEQQGYTALKTESRPFHVLFGVYCWSLIQDPGDPKVRMAGFGHRVSREMVWTALPEDFGTPGYGGRRQREIERYFKKYILPHATNRRDMLWLFDYWLMHSEDFRQYLWAHDKEDVDAARSVVGILPPQVLLRILRYLVDAYWGRYLGWPDLIVCRSDEFMFVEVKSSSDKLSEDQKNWIRDNHDKLYLPFKIVKIHKKDAIDTGD